MKQHLLTQLRDYLFFSKRERRALLIFTTLAGILFFIINRFNFQTNSQESILLDSFTVNKFLYEDKKKEQLNTETFTYSSSNQEDKHDFDQSSDQPTSFFEFDPNKAGYDDWEKLGVRESVINTIIKYREKGGRFTQPEDLRRIFGLPSVLCEKLIPYVRIPSPDIQTKNEEDNRRSKKQITELNINIAKPEEWKMLDGIGEGYARRIVQFREKLGGFYKVEQVAETFGLPDSVFQKIKPQLVITSGPYGTIDLNSVVSDELKKHPYIDYRTAKNIISYRNQHGNFQSVNDLQKIGNIDDALFQKISPYLIVK
jgi:competence protein ComEA